MLHLQNIIVIIDISCVREKKNEVDQRLYELHLGALVDAVAGTQELFEDPLRDLKDLFAHDRARGPQPQCRGELLLPHRQTE